MASADAAGSRPSRGFALAAIAVAGLLFSLTPIAERLDDSLLDAQWSLLRKFAPKPGRDDIMVVGIDEATVRSIEAPPGLWHEPIGRALEKISAARPRAIGMDLHLPERSYETFRAGLEAPLLQGILAARGHSPVVASLSIDARTRAARPIHAPFLAALGEQGLGIGLLGRDADGTTRRFSLAIPTEEGTYPTFAGRLCRTLARHCSDGLIDYALGEPLRYVPLRDVLAASDLEYLGRLFRDRIVLIGDVRAADRVAVPVNLAGWEPGGRGSATVVVHAQSLRTAMAGAPSEAARPLAIVLVAFAAVVGLMRDWRMAILTALLAALVLFVAATVSLRAGAQIPLAAALATALGAASWRWTVRGPADRGMPNIPHFP